VNNENTPNEGIPENEIHSQPLLAVANITGESELKDYLIEFTGNRLNPDDEIVKVHMIAEVLAAEFPEFVYAFAEENFLRGYKLGLEDAYKTITREAEEAEPEE
tara:strand:- start:49 stop:360 length:312 start_codon:yes stop_codon:yes gene_type:complete